MAYSISFCVVILLWVFVGLSHGIDVDKNLMGAYLASGGKGGSTSTMPCVQKLLPCQAALASHTKNPPASCCVPLKEMMTNDAQCLCTLFANADVMKGLNVTQHEALNFAKACGAKPDLSLCKKAAASSPGSSATPSVPTTPSVTNSSTSSNKTASPPAASTASVTSKFGGIVAFASFMSSVMLLAF